MYLTWAQVPTIASEVPDTASVFQAPYDSLSVPYDSLGRMSIPSLVGTYDRHLDSGNVISREKLHWLEYRSLGGILEQYPGVFLRNQYSEGQYSQLNIRGTDWRGIAITLDGRLLNDPASGIYNPFYFSTEYADRIEVVTGPRAFLYGLNSTGGAINLVTKNYNSNRPFSKLNYSESGYNYSYTDGTFSQNISRKINVTLGFQQQSTDGRFENSEHEQWNGRVKLRYNVSKSLNIILSDYFIHTQTGLNGGVDLATVVTGRAFDPLLATMVNTDAYEKVTRHDVDLSFVGTLIEDTSNVSLLTFYYSRSIREYRDEENRVNPNGIFIQSDHTSSWMGALLRQNFDTEIQRLNLGANLEIRQIEGSPNLGRRRNVIGSVWVTEEVHVGGIITVGGFGRYDHYLKESFASYGGDINVQFQPSLRLFAGISSSRRLPNYQELYWVGGSSLEPEKHTRVEVGVQVSNEHLSLLRAVYFQHLVDRTIQPQLLLGFPFWGVSYQNSEDTRRSGLDLSVALRFGWFYLEGTGMFIPQKLSSGPGSSEYPTFAANGGIYFWDKIIDDKLDLKVGFRGRYFRSHSGSQFNPEMLAYPSDAGFWIEGSGSVDFQATARIGDAYIQLIWENLTNQHYFTTPYYPVLDREIRFGLSWQFLD